MRLLLTAERRGCVSELTEATGLPASKLSRHVQVLVWTGPLKAERSGRNVWLTPCSGDPQMEYIQASVLAAPDPAGQFQADLGRLAEAEHRGE
jgi:DNA-binding IclR family transcriptional regulator